MGFPDDFSTLLVVLLTIRLTRPRKTSLGNHGSSTSTSKQLNSLISTFGCSCPSELMGVTHLNPMLRLTPRGRRPRRISDATHFLGDRAYAYAHSTAEATIIQDQEVSPSVPEAPRNLTFAELQSLIEQG
jgi:hypothetical protein